MTRITDYVAKIATWKTILASLVTMLARQQLFFLWIDPELESRTGGNAAPDIEPLYDVDYLNDFLTLSNQAGLDYYISHFFALDLVFPLAGALFFCLALMGAAKRVFAPGSRLRLLAFLPLAGTVCDYLESVGIVVAIKRTPDVSHSFLVAITTLSTLKFLFAALSLLLLVGLLVTLAFRTYRRRNAASLSDRSRNESSLSDR